MQYPRAGRARVSQLLKDGTMTEDRRLDRLVYFDERSREYPIRALVGRKKPRSYTWRMTRPVLDQGPDGACVGFAVTHELMARPAESDPPGDDAKFAKEKVYWEAQKIDPWAGGSYPNSGSFYEGTSVLAGLKIGFREGYYDEYRWSFTLEDFVLGLGRHGPAVIGVWWHGGMFRPNEDGFIAPISGKYGGHAVLVTAVKIVWKKGSAKATMDDVDLDKSYVTILNSWGPNWGLGGFCKMTLRNIWSLLVDQGEAAFMVKRTTEPTP